MFGNTISLSANLQDYVAIEVAISNCNFIFMRCKPMYIIPPGVTLQSNSEFHL